MAVKPGDTVTVDFPTHSPTTGAATDADSLPTGVLIRNGADTAESVTVTNKETGVYKAAVTIPAGYVAGDEVQIRIHATVGGVADKEVVWGATLDSPRFYRAVEAITLGTVGAGATTTSIPTSSLDPAATVTDQFKGQILCFGQNTATAALRGQKTDILGSATDGTLTVTALTSAPASGDVFTIQ